jgi:hypothetical protein
MPKAQPPSLIGGPYKAPRYKIGEPLHDRLRGDVIVLAISKAPIPWPMSRARWTGKSAREFGDWRPLVSMGAQGRYYQDVETS